MTDHQQAAIEAAAEAMLTEWNPERYPVMTALFRDYSVSAITAAEPHLRKKWAEEVREEKTRITSIDVGSNRAFGMRVGLEVAAKLLEGAGE